MPVDIASVEQPNAELTSDKEGLGATERLKLSLYVENRCDVSHQLADFGQVLGSFAFLSVSSCVLDGDG